MENRNGRARDPRDYKIRRVGAFSLSVLAVVAIGRGTSGLAGQVGESFRAHHHYHDRTERAPNRQQGSSVIGWIRNKMSSPRPSHEDKYAQAMILTNEVEQKMRERAASPDPFRAVMADIWIQRHDVALVTRKVTRMTTHLS